MLDGWRRVLRPAAVGASALGLAIGVFGAGAGVAGAAPRAKKVTNFVKYVGGHGKANAKLSPVYIGVVNQRTSTNAIAPVFTTGAKLAAQYVNHHTHGIDGHPLKLVFCAIPTTVGSAAKCGQEFANNNKIDAVVGGAIDVGNTALETALKPSKKPIFLGVSLSTVDVSDPNGFILYGTGTGIAAPMATFAKTVVHAKKVSVTYPSNIPAEVQGANILQSALNHEGISTVYKVGFTAADTNLTGPMEAAHAATTTLLITYNSGGPACSDTYLALKTLGIHTKVLANGPCFSPTIAKADGGQLPLGWYYAEVFDGTTTVGAFDKVAKEYNMTGPGKNPFTVAGFGQTLTVAKFETEILKAHKKLTPRAVEAKARAFKGPVVQGAPKLECGKLRDIGPAVCSDVDSFLQNTAPNVLKKVALWIGPPKGFKPPKTG